MVKRAIAIIFKAKYVHGYRINPPIMNQQRWAILTFLFCYCKNVGINCLEKMKHSVCSITYKKRKYKYRSENLWWPLRSLSKSEMQLQIWYWSRLNGFTTRVMNRWLKVSWFIQCPCTSNRFLSGRKNVGPWRNSNRDAVLCCGQLCQ